MRGESCERGWGRAGLSQAASREGLLGRDFGKLSQHRQRDCARVRREELEIPWQCPKRAGALRRAAVLRQFCLSRGEGGSRSPKSALIPCTLRQERSPAMTKGFAPCQNLPREREGCGEELERPSCPLGLTAPFQQGDTGAGCPPVLPLSQGRLVALRHWGPPSSPGVICL